MSSSAPQAPAAHPKGGPTWRRLSDAASRDPWLFGAMTVLLAAVIAPFWATGLLPFMDLPQHLAAIRVLHSLNDPAFGLGPYHEIALGETQYLLYYLSVDALTHLMPLETANRVVLSIYAVALPLAMASYLRAFGRDPAVALLAGPLVFNTSLFMGFVNYVVAFPLLFWSLGLLRRLLDHFTYRRALLLTALTVLIFYSHAQIFVLYLLMAGLLGLLGGRGLHPRHWWRQSLHLLPTLALFALWLQRSAFLADAETWETGHGGRNVSPTEVHFEPILDRLTAIPHNLISAYRDASDEWILAGLLTLAGVGLLLRRFAPSDAEIASHGSARAWLRARTPELMAFTAFAVYLLSPLSYKWVWPISHRLVPVVALFGLGLLGWRRLPARPVVLIIPALALGLFAAKNHVTQARAFEAEAGAIHDVLAHAEPGRKLTSLIFDRGSAVLNQPVYLHFGQYYLVRRGGVATFTFEDFPQSPVRFRPEEAPPRLPNRWEWTPERFQLDPHGLWYDYFLVRDGGERRPRRPFGPDPERVQLLVRQGQWALYLRGDDPTPPTAPPP